MAPGKRERSFPFKALFLAMCREESLPNERQEEFRWQQD
jgi:hypothetical protein